MRQHHGAHPRMGATDVCPLIPVSGISLEECAELARGLAKKVADELGIPTYCYEAAAFVPERKNLAVCRAGEYEALPEKMNQPGKGPDFGDRPFDEAAARTGATTIGARDFLYCGEFQPQFHLYPPRQCHSIRRAREGPSDARRRQADRQTPKG